MKNNIFLIMNLISFTLMGIDKYKAIKQERRISERRLLSFSLFGGAFGTLIGMIIFRHKIRKPKFYILVPLFVLLLSFIYIKIPN